MNKNFFDFLQEIGFDKNQTRIEKYRLDGTSNYLISLNNSGVTWAVSLRIPAIGINYAQFENEKLRAISTADFMSKRLSKPTSITKNISFLFDGKSTLVPYEAVFDFFEYQNSLSPLIEIDKITGKSRQKNVKGEAYPTGIDRVENIDGIQKEKIKKYFSEYKGNFFASKGAPASETLDNYFDLVLEVTKSLAVLHTKTGLIERATKENILSITSIFDNKLDEMEKAIVFQPESPSQRSFEKYQGKWNQEMSPEITQFIRKEIILRTDPGKRLLSELITPFNNDIKYHCFTHNDPHCENFIIVKYLYTFEQLNHHYIDREFLNDIIDFLCKEDDHDGKLSIEYIKEENTLLYRRYNTSDIGKENINIVKSSLHYDIHLIDIDDATGVEPDTRRPYFSDLLVYAVSAANLGAIKNRSIKVEDIISAYYDYTS